jgi:beta-glucosidase/6-phospho-beta-glucosidase/beta-galactosidase
MFTSFFMGGFECSTHRLRSGRRLDVVHSTRHDALAFSDYRLLQRHGMHTARDGLRWHLIDRGTGAYDFSSAQPMLQAARAAGTQVIWDLWHYGWPDDLDIFSAAFVERFAAFATAAAARLSEHSDAPIVSPINEISFFAWAGGEEGFLNPFAKHRGDEIKRQLVRAAIAGIRAMREVNPAIRIAQVDPITNVIARSEAPDDLRNAAAYRASQFEAWDMITGRAQREFGGADELIDVIGVNYYIHNQFVWGGPMVVPSDPRYRHVSEMIQEVYERYRRPVFVAETGIEGDARPAWLRYMCREVYTAMAAGVPVAGLCLYPILNHPGWDDDRHCHNGLFDYSDDAGGRAVFTPLAIELAQQRTNVAALQAGHITLDDIPGMDTTSLDWAAHMMQELTDENRSSEP